MEDRREGIIGNIRRGIASNYSAEWRDVFTKEGWIYSPDWKYALLVKSSPALKYSELATNQHRLGHPFYLDDVDLQNDLQNQESLKVNPDLTIKIPVLRMDEEVVPSFLFEDLT